MSWVRFPDGLRLDPVAQGSAEALVVLLHDGDASAAALTAIAQRWAPAVPRAAFTILDRLDPVDGQSGNPIDISAEWTALDRAARHLAPLLEQQLHFYSLEARHLVLVGFGYGGTLALHMVLHQRWSCAGVLALTARPIFPPPRVLRIGRKVRLIESVAPGPVVRSSLRDVVAQLAARGIDTRGVLLAGSTLSDEVIRHGGAYLVELVATAQEGDHLHHLNPESNHAW
jgi:hypothetical protein